MIAKPRIGRITQGTIFCAARAEHYNSKPVWGVVITARCDTTHEKTPVVNYLPIVTVEDWLACHGGLLAIDREEADCYNRMKLLLSKKGLSESLLAVHTPSDVASTHFQFPIEDVNSRQSKEQAKDAGSAKKVADRISTLKECLAQGLPNEKNIKSAIVDSKKFIEAVVKDLVAHKLSGYYFIPSIGELSEKTSKSGYVVILREVHHVSRQGVIALVDGISPDLNSTHQAYIRFDCFDFAYPVAELISPWTEHLLQSFCNLFGRIGINDVDKKIVEEISDSFLQDIQE